MVLVHLLLIISWSVEIYYKYVKMVVSFIVLIIYPIIVLFMLYYKIVLDLLVKIIMMIMGVKKSVQNLHGIKQV